MESETTNIRSELLHRGQVFRVTKGVSMEPLLKERQNLVDIRAYGEGKPQVGHVVLFERDNGQLVLHRIIELREEKYYICGDNCAYGELVRREQILGQAVRYLKEDIWYSMTEEVGTGFLRKLYWKRLWLRLRGRISRIAKPIRNLFHGRNRV